MSKFDEKKAQLLWEEIFPPPCYPRYQSLDCLTTCKIRGKGVYNTLQIWDYCKWAARCYLASGGDRRDVDFYKRQLAETKTLKYKIEHFLGQIICRVLRLD